MGRDWYRLGGGGGGNGVNDGDGGGGNGGGGGGGREVSSFNTKRNNRSHESRKTNSRNAASGCMAALFQFFDFHHFYFPSHHHPTIDSLPKHPKGLVPPRNSLELTEESPSSTTYKDKEILKIPIGIKVKTQAGSSRSKLRALAMETSSSSSEMGNSPGTKTPNLVARLMGLDLLPDSIDHNHSSPDLHTMSSHSTRSRITGHRLSLSSKTTGTRSLPESPRVSSSRKSDFDIHRLSLQLNKENKFEEFGYSRLKELKQQEESRSPRDYARQILNQIKERVITRRVGMDITNTVKNREAEPGRKHYELKRNYPISCSPRDRFPEKENKTSFNQKTKSLSMSRPDQIYQQSKLPQPPPRAPDVQENLRRVKQQELRPINRCKKADSETLSSPRSKKPRLTSNIRNKQQEVFFATSRNSKAKPCLTSNIRNKQQEVFFATSKNSKAKHYTHLDKKRSKRNAVSNDLIDSFVPVKKVPSPPATKLPQKQVNVSHPQGPERNSKPSIRLGQTYKHEENLLQVARNPNLDDATAIAATSTTAGGTGIDVELEYVTRILSYAGIRNTDSPVSSATWSSHPHPLDLSIFQNLEHLGKNPSGSLAFRCNRRLLFDLVNQILIDVLNPHTTHRRNYNGSEIIRELCSSIVSYPRTSFLNPEDIDALFAGNLPETKKLEEEGEGIVAEIERDIVDALVEETTSDLYLYRTSQNGVGLVAST